MGVSCMAANCACSYCFGEDNQYQGNIIFQPIKTKIIQENDKFTEEEREVLEDCEKNLKESEEKREIIAEKFRDMLDNTGAGVLFQPSLERAIISFIIYFFEQIILCAKEKQTAPDKNYFSKIKFIEITKESPFVKFIPGFLDNLKTKYGFDMDMLEKLAKAQKSIINFLSTIFDTENVIKGQLDIFEKLIFKFSRNWHLVYKLKDSIDGIKFVSNYFKELASSLVLAQNQLSNPKKIESFFKIAEDAAERGITDPKELVLIYSLGDNCGNPEKWKENMVYKKVVILKY